MTPQDVGIALLLRPRHQGPAGNFYLVPVDVDADNLAGTCICRRSPQAGAGRHAGPADRRARRLPFGRRPTTAAPPRRRLADDLVRDLVSDDYGIIVMSSSLGREYSLESPAIDHGFFTLALVEGLSGQADLNRDGLIHLTELDAYAGRASRS